MDRFIDTDLTVVFTPQKNLKSNMDRFIAVNLPSGLTSIGKFKIQYG